MLLFKRFLTLFALSAFLCFFCSCVHDSLNSGPGQGNFVVGAVPYIYPSNLVIPKTLKYNYYDLEQYISQGLGWTPVILTNESSHLSEFDFLVGYWDSKDNVTLPPSEGSCRLVNDESLGDASKGQFKFVKFVSANEHPEVDANELFFILNSQDHQVLAMVRFNKFGEANCFLPDLQYNISTGYGQLRREFKLDLFKNRIPIVINSKSNLVIEPSDKNGIKEGDIIRIGRRFSNTDMNELYTDVNYEKFLISSKLTNDLFLPANFQSQKMNVSEYLQTSLLVGNNPFKIHLSDAFYTVAILRKNKLICIQSVNLKNDSDMLLSCPVQNNNLIEQNPQQGFEDFYFDASFYPQSFLEAKPFHDWIFASGQYLIMMPSAQLENEINTELKKNTIDQNFFLLFQNNITKSPEFLSTSYNYSPIQNKDNDAASTYFALNSEVSSNFITTKRSEVIKNRDTIPLGGESDRWLARGAVPFSVFTKVTSPSSGSDFLLSASVQASNGVIMKWFEPNLLLGNGKYLSSIFRQNFHIWLVVPEWNSTNIVELFINDKFYKRWVLDRGDISKPFSTILETKTSVVGSYNVRMIAWGEEFLPDFLTGMKNSLPFCTTRYYCVVSDGKDTCNSELKN